MTYSIGGIFLPAELFDAWQANRSMLGDPIWVPLVEGPVRYVNFRNGYVSHTEGEPPLAVIGGSYQPKQLPGGPCVAHDRPCLVRAERDGTTIHLAWHWRIADAFNVSWHLPGGSAEASVEVAGNEYVMTGTQPDVTFVIQLQACDKRFLSSSICSPVASYVISPGTR